MLLNYKKAYDDFDYIKVSLYNEDKVNALLQNPGIIRNRLKILASINNAKLFIKIQEEYGSFDSYICGFVDNIPVTNHWNSISDVPATSALSDRVSKDLKIKGFNS